MIDSVTSIATDAIVVGSRIRTNTPHIAALAESIRSLGLLHPVVVNTRHELVAGFRRLTAVKQLGWTTVPVRVVDTLDDALAALKAEMDENTCRVQLTPVEIVELGRKIEAIERPEAAKRKQAGKNQHSEPEGNFPQGSTGKTRDKVGEALGVSGKTYEKAKRVVEQGVPELVEMMNTDTVSIDAAEKVVKLPVDEQKEVVKAGPKAVKEKAKELKTTKKRSGAQEDVDREGQGLCLLYRAMVEDLELVGGNVDDFSEKRVYDAVGIQDQDRLVKLMENVGRKLLRSAGEIRRRAHL